MRWRLSVKNNLFLSVLMLYCEAVTCAEATIYPLTIENCGLKETFTATPTRVVTIGQHETELLLALGLENNIRGTAVWFSKLPPDLEKEGHSLKRLADNAPGFEAVAAQNPDLVLAQYSWHVGPQGEVATRAQLEQLGIKTWISPADCLGKSVTDSSNGDGARTTPYTLDYIFQEIRELSSIFNVSDRGKQLEKTLSDRIAAARQQVSGATQKPLRIVYWFSSSRLKGDPWVAGSDGAPGWISKTLGVENIVKSHEEWPAVTWEHIVQSKPDIIVIASMERRLYPADEVSVKKTFLQSDPVTREMPAVKQGNIVIVPAMSLNPSLRNVEAVELISGQIAALQKKS